VAFVDQRSPLAALAGAVSAGVALAIGEVVSVLGPQGQSLVGSVAGEVVDRTPGSVIHSAIEALGTNDKPVLLTLITLICLLLGAVAGVVGLRRRSVITPIFLLAALLGLLAGWHDPLATRWVVVVAAIAAAISGSVTLQILLRRMPTRASTAPDSLTTGGSAPGAVPIPAAGAGSRRSFFALTAGLGAGAVVVAAGGRALSDRSRSGSVGTSASPCPRFLLDHSHQQASMYQV
jgi:hypothetical protein